MSDMITSVEVVEEVRPVELSADLLDDQLIGKLVDRARSRGLQLTGRAASAAADQARAGVRPRGRDHRPSGL
jgi:hypothetical protein